MFDTNKSDAHDFLGKLNLRLDSIKFTAKQEVKNEPPSSDALVFCNTQNKLQIDNYRKRTNTNYIHSS